MATQPTNQKKIHGYKIVCNNLTKLFQVDLKSRVIFFNTNFFEKLSDIELEFTVRWAKIARKRKTVNITEIDEYAIKWFCSKYGNEAFNCFLEKINDIDSYHRLSFGHMKNNAKRTIWQKTKIFFAKKR